MQMQAITLTRQQLPLKLHALPEPTNRQLVRHPVYMQMQVTMSMPLEPSLKQHAPQEPTNRQLVRRPV